MIMAKRFGKVKSYEDWIQPKIVKNAIKLLEKEIPKNKDEIKFVHLCFTTDPFMYEKKEVSDLSLKIIGFLNEKGIKCTALTKGALPIELTGLSKENEFGITLISLNEDFRNKYEPYSAPYQERINRLYSLHREGLKTWVSIEPYPTPNIIDQDFDKILDEISFVDKIIFGRLNYNSRVTRFPGFQFFYNKLSEKVINYCKERGKDYHIKKGTVKLIKKEDKNISLSSLLYAKYSI
jgi:DNA repair photolyase